MPIVTPSLTQWGNEDCHTRDHAEHIGLLFHKTAHSRHDIPSKGALDKSFFMRFWGLSSQFKHFRFAINH